MCGLVGIAARAFVASETCGPTVRRMTSLIRHRGPDDEGIWLDPEAGVALGHRRLSIVDLSPAGHQPMHSGSGRYVIAFNGEIYNHEQIRAELVDQGVAGWRGHSDTETLLAAIDRWGLTEALGRAVGMFAFALFDRQRRKLFLARDRLGEKPLYYGYADGDLIFASELQALSGYPKYRPSLDRQAIAQYMALGDVPAPRSIYENTFKVRPAEILAFDLAGDLRNPSAERYWTARDAAQGPRFAGTPGEAAEQLDALLSRSVRQQMVADVPVGAFLSGGIDSSSVVAHMQTLASGSVKTFCIGFEEDAFNEATHAAAVARHLGTDHQTLIVSADVALQTARAAGGVWDEPFADSSQIPTLLVAKMAREQVTVSLSGDGGDELFGGYNRYLASKRIEALPGKGLVARALRLASDDLLVGLARRMPGPLSRKVNHHRVRVLRELLAQPGRMERYVDLCYHPAESRRYLAGCPIDGALFEWLPPDSLELLSAFSILDLETYLPDDILVKVDRAAMSVSLETRVPLLDHRIVEFAFSLPDSIKLREGRTKWPLRTVLDKYVPRSIVDRPKMGFGVPMEAWLRGPLREWAADLLSPAALRHDQVFDADLVEQIWRRHLSGTADTSTRLWKILSFQSWRLAHG